VIRKDLTVQLLPIDVSSVDAVAVDVKFVPSSSSSSSSSSSTTTMMTTATTPQQLSSARSTPPTFSPSAFSPSASSTYSTSAATVASADSAGIGSTGTMMACDHHHGVAHHRHGSTGDSSTREPIDSQQSGSPSKRKPAQTPVSSAFSSGEKRPRSHGVVGSASEPLVAAAPVHSLPSVTAASLLAVSHRLSGHTGNVLCLELDLHRLRLYSGSQDATIRVRRLLFFP
jgi:hypothetical protein